MDGYNDSIVKALNDGKNVYKRRKDTHRNLSRSLYAISNTLKGHCYVITGTTSGLGKAVAAHLIALGSTVILPVRRKPEGFKQDLIDYSNELFTKYNNDIVSQASKDQIILVNLDLAKWEMFGSTIEEIKTALKDKKLFGLVNNAGLMNPSSAVNEFNAEMSLAVNGIGTIMFTEALIKAKILSKENIIINVSSEEHRSSKSFDINTTLLSQVTPNLEGISNSFHRYAFSKLVLTTYGASMKAEGFNLIDICPGAVATDIALKFTGVTQIIGKICSYFMKKGWFGFLLPEEAALPILQYLTTDENLEDTFHSLRGESVKPRADVFDTKTQKWLKSEIESLIKKYDIL